MERYSGIPKKNDGKVTRSRKIVQRKVLYGLRIMGR